MTLTVEGPVSLLGPAARHAAPPVPTVHAAPSAPPRARDAAPTELPTAAPTIGPAPTAAQHGRRLAPVPAAPPARRERGQRPGARRASSASTLAPAVLARSAGLVAVRVLGTATAAAAVTAALAVRHADGVPPGELASLGVRGLAAAAILGAAWGFQDGARLGRLETRRVWHGVATALALVHATWMLAALPGAGPARLATAAATFALDVALVAAPALIGARAGRARAAVTGDL